MRRKLLVFIMIMATVAASACSKKPAAFDKFQDYLDWAEETGYKKGVMEPVGTEGVNNDIFHTLNDSGGYDSGRIVIGDSRCCQLGIYQERIEGSDYAVFAVWGGDYSPETKYPILTEKSLADIEACFRNQIEKHGSCTIYFFTTVNNYDFRENNNADFIKYAIDSAEILAQMEYEYNGTVYSPVVIVIGFDGCRNSSKVLGLDPADFNRYVEDYNNGVKEALGKSEILKTAYENYTTVVDIEDGKTKYIDDGLHYSDDVLRDITEYIVSSEIK
ncbi:MAG: hypothetical protein IJM62_00925 [Lachnospiraceae bacterium]|nr:hypothetical protein [Lachnospiraceae bacterium]